jgi:hypothetical protein
LRQLSVFDDEQFFGAIWNDMFFILWTCGAVAAVRYALAARRLSALHNALAISAALVALLATPAIAADYLGYQGPTFQSALALRGGYDHLPCLDRRFVDPRCPAGESFRRLWRPLGEQRATSIFRGESAPLRETTGAEHIDPAS